MSDNNSEVNYIPLTIDDIINNVADATMFAGNPNLLTHVEWYEEGLRHKLIQARASQDETATEALLRAIGKVSPNKCYTSPEGAWSPHSTYTSEFHKSKARAEIVDCDYSDKTKDMWKKTMSAINKVVNSLPAKNGIANKPVDLRQMSLQVRHSAFQLVKSHAEFEAEQQKLEQIDEHMRMETWKCKNTECQSMLSQLIDNNRTDIETRSEFYVGKPIPVFDLNGDAVPPPYDHRLVGAIVEVAFILSHDLFGNKKDNFYADIAYITILKEPPPPATKRSYDAPTHLLAKKKRET